MILLAVDTISKSSSAALLDNGAVLAESTWGRAETHSKHLMNLIHAVMERAAVEIAQVDLYAVTVGPGSFTGVRIGISAVKGLAFAHGKKTVGVSSLATLVEPFGDHAGLLCPMLDARRGEVYFSRYHAVGGKINQECPEQALPPIQAVAPITGPCLFVGDGAAAYQAEIAAVLGPWAAFGTPEQNVIQAAAVGRLAEQLYHMNQTLSAAELTPCYLRKSDAEKMRKAPQ